MRKKPTHCEVDLLNRFMDQEVTADEQQKLLEHLETCPRCQEIERNHRILAADFRAGVERTIPHADLRTLEDAIIDKRGATEVSWTARARKVYETRKRPIPAMAMVGLLIILFSSTKHEVHETGPSAIIQSFSGDVSRVMFLETLNSRQTIIWFNDASKPTDGEKVENVKPSNA